MGKIAFTMRLNRGQAVEYGRRHAQIWPELLEQLKQAGISDYTIFLDEETHVLFGVMAVAPDNMVAMLPTQAIMRKWWAYMADIMETHPDNEPVTKPLAQVFHLD